jgi:hypothetical protein
MKKVAIKQHLLLPLQPCVVLVVKPKQVKKQLELEPKASFQKGKR